MQHSWDHMLFFTCDGVLLDHYIGTFYWSVGYMLVLVYETTQILFLLK